MNEYLRQRYGDPCRTCGYSWSVDLDMCASTIDAVPARFEALLAGRSGSARHASLEWNAPAYVEHVADTIRIWAERVAAAALGASEPVVPYDEGALGSARGYQRLPLQGALWSLHRSVDDWHAAEALAVGVPVTLRHPEQQTLGLDHVRRILAHEIQHHTADLTLILST